MPKPLHRKVLVTRKTGRWTKAMREALREDELLTAIREEHERIETMTPWGREQYFAQMGAETFALPAELQGKLTSRLDTHAQGGFEE